MVRKVGTLNVIMLEICLRFVSNRFGSGLGKVAEIILDCHRKVGTFIFCKHTDPVAPRILISE